ncbi:hypothetical protein V6N13_026861 [Hibiscus sabdariffa]|uniref:Uncharacterized protein n=2 Tax=Hibiscus sabdariffa TaxID=183260 RepID=A0ABR2ARW2_9ROSI
MEDGTVFVLVVNCCLCIHPTLLGLSISWDLLFCSFAQMDLPHLLSASHYDNSTNMLLACTDGAWCPLPCLLILLSMSSSAYSFGFWQRQGSMIYSFSDNQLLAAVLFV